MFDLMYFLPNLSLARLRHNYYLNLNQLDFHS